MDYHADFGLDPADFRRPSGAGADSSDPAANGAAAGATTYARTITIECDGRPAAEVLEIAGGDHSLKVGPARRGWASRPCAEACRRVGRLAGGQAEEQAGK